MILKEPAMSIIMTINRAYNYIAEIHVHMKDSISLIESEELHRIDYFI